MPNNFKQTNQQGTGALVLIIILAILAIVGYLIYTNNLNLANLFSQNSSQTTNTNTTNTNKTSTNNTTPQQALVTITKSGFVPSTIKIKVGDLVKWTNTDSNPHTATSDPHPTHTNFPSLDSDTLNKNESFSLKFEKKGTYSYHDHLNPSLKATVIVE